MWDISRLVNMTVVFETDAREIPEQTTISPFNDV
ncbi:hypothetical protein J3D54_004053 [Pseudomonas sp. GGS8]|nr:hypothetical protein [Pseudomonas sp. GGS8]